MNPAGDFYDTFGWSEGQAALIQIRVAGNIGFNTAPPGWEPVGNRIVSPTGA